MARIRAVQCVSYLKDVRRVEGASGVEDAVVIGAAPVKVYLQSRDPDILHVEKGGLCSIHCNCHELHSANKDIRKKINNCERS